MSEIPSGPPLCPEASSVPHLLCVEDDPDILSLLVLALETIGGLRVTSCTSGAEALALAPVLAPDLVLLDVMMPGMDGIETLARLRSDARTRGLPVVFLTAKVQPQEIATYRRLGARGVIPKPFDPMRLADQVRGYLGDDPNPIAL
ncbi:Alkaline phosphatase synthesis transcriptional regulatory protein PhoP [bacterium HR40]|nr:Alkaline phosphatase synthesis transcriptional regulatory protein PhoP [bacterium HR40]